jgi:hypothetical protein
VRQIANSLSALLLQPWADLDENASAQDSRPMTSIWMNSSTGTAPGGYLTNGVALFPVAAVHR